MHPLLPKGVSPADEAQAEMQINPGQVGGTVASFFCREQTGRQTHSFTAPSLNTKQEITPEARRSDSRL